MECPQMNLSTSYYWSSSPSLCLFTAFPSFISFGIILNHGLLCSIALESRKTAFFVCTSASSCNSFCLLTRAAQSSFHSHYVVEEEIGYVVYESVLRAFNMSTRTSVSVMHVSWSQFEVSRAHN